MSEHFTEESDEYYEWDEKARGHYQDHLNYLYLTTAEDIATEDANIELREVLCLEPDVQNANITTANGRKISTSRVISRLLTSLTN